MDDYSPVVSDIEDGNDDENVSSKTKKPHKDDAFNLIDQILNENSLHKDEEDEGNITGPDEEIECNECCSIIHCILLSKTFEYNFYFILYCS